MSETEELKSRLLNEYIEKEAWQPRWSFMMPLILMFWATLGIVISTWFNLLGAAVEDPTGIFTILYIFGLSIFVGGLTILCMLPLVQRDRDRYEKRLQALREKYLG